MMMLFLVLSLTANSVFANHPDDEFCCKTGRVCIPKSWVCDHFSDCLDNSDEFNCTKHSFYCEFSDRFVCKNNPNRCIPNSWKCDKKIDCDDGSDEEDCSTSSCASLLGFQCKNGNCVPKLFQCDGEDDCGDNSDEDQCNIITKLPPWLKQIIPTIPPLLEQDPTTLTTSSNKEK